MGELKDGIREYFVEQDILVDKEHDFRKTVNFIVHFNEDSKDTNRTCRMFESARIPCTHMICIWKNKKLSVVPDKYILHRWRKDVVRSHMKMKVSYSNWQTKQEWRRYDCLKQKFNEGADQVIHSEEMSVWLDGKLDDIIQEAKARNESINTARNVVASSQEISGTIGDPCKGVKRGRATILRKQSIIEKKGKQLTTTRNKLVRIRSKENITPVHNSLKTISFVVHNHFLCS
ncbi:hypothetical protein Dimus_031912 [Dionaea muscipula]